MKPPLMCVTDTNIWIDLENGEVLELIFELPYQFITTDFAADELDATLWASLEALGVEAYGLSSEQIKDIYLLIQSHHTVSTTDLSTLVLARDLPAILLSGDNPLRKLAEEQAIEVHGVLWVLDALVAQQLITPGQACHSLKNMLARNARLPKVPCNKRLKQ
jgi:predicted nucleic acid-binding protein